MVRKPDLVPRPLSQAANNPPYPTTPPDEHPPPFLHDPNAADTNGYQFVSHEDARRSRSNSDISSSSDWDEPEDDDDDAVPKDEIPAALRVGGGRPTSSQAAKSGEQDLPATLRVGPPGGSPAPRISIDSEDDRPKFQEKTEEKKPEPQPSTASPPPIVTSPPPTLGAAPQTVVEPPTPVVSPPPAVTSPPPAPATPEASAAPDSSTSTPTRRPTIPLQSQNPYLNLQTQSSGQSSNGGEDTNAIWGASSSQEPVELPLDNKTPVEQISKLSLWDNGEPATQSPPARPPPGVPEDPSSPAPSSKRHESNASSAFNPGMDISSLDAVTSRSHGLPADEDANQGRTWQEQQAWEKSERERREREAAEAYERALQEERERQAEEEWHRGEEAAKVAAQSAAQPAAQPEPAPQPELAPQPEERPPQLPPRPATGSEQPPPKPPRPQHTTDSAADLETQRRENYSIKHIRWFDSHTDNLRDAPILTQNANGPCPLLALVNALVLSTPIKQHSTLVDALKTRETISLGLLLDAVFDELVSGQRGSVAQDLPDVGDLYAFLLALHTGMNVNPQFVASETASLIDHPTPQGSAKAGSFEETREMRLYSTFKIALIHGWLPPSESRAYAAFDRVAKTYEDAQNVQFNEEELEAKLSSSGLSPEEQSLYEDLQAIKEFLQRWPTQLTDYGLNVIKNSLKAGQIAILFRNDHFSTIYKEPRTQKVMTLVTDTGYSSHEEIVWESLVDVTGRGSELFSGDFRPVSHSTQAGPERPIRSLLDDDTPSGPGFPNGGGITYPQQSGTIGSEPTGGLDRNEQEDADLALAMQLQEEEDDRHRRETDARRRRENELSHNFLSQEATSQVARVNSDNTTGTRPPRINDPIRGSDVRPLIPPRRNNVQTHRPAADGEEPPPPTYEQAANSPVYVPGQNGAAGLPNPPQGAGAGRGAMHGRGQSAYSANSQSYWLGGRGNAAGRGRRTSQPAPVQGNVAPSAAGPSAAGVGHGRRPSAGGPGKDDKCVVM